MRNYDDDNFQYFELSDKGSITNWLLSKIIITDYRNDFIKYNLDFVYRKQTNNLTVFVGTYTQILQNWDFFEASHLRRIQKRLKIETKDL